MSSVVLVVLALFLLLTGGGILALGIDVYKRQVFHPISPGTERLWQKSMRKNRLPAGLHSVSPDGVPPVSYTHLLFLRRFENI